MKEDILRLLSKNSEQYISGEEISSKLNVSRTAIWKHINALRNDGYVIDSQARLGYKLIYRPDSLTAEEIKSGLNTRLIGNKIVSFAQVTSTNEVAKELAIKGEVSGTIIISEQQTKGKGRLGRHWESPYGKGIWCSVILRPSILPMEAPKYTFISAVAVVEAIREVANLEAKIKWPNDLIINGKKMCGILTELSAEIERINFIILGIGINVNHTLNDFPEELHDLATSVFLETGNIQSRVKLIRAIISKLEEKNKLFTNHGFSAILDLWKQYSATIGQEIIVKAQEESYEGIAEDIDDLGQLVVRLPGGETYKVLAGDVSIRKKTGQYA